MSILKGRRSDSFRITGLQPDEDTEMTVKQWKKEGIINIYNPETGEKY